MLKKICFVDEDGRFGGPQQRMLSLASELKKKNIDVDIIIPKDETEIFKKKLEISGINFHELSITRLSLKITFLIKYFLLFFYEIILLIVYFKKEKYDLIQANSTPQFKAVIAGFLCRLKIVWVIEDSYFPGIIVFMFKILSNFTNCKIIYTSQRVYEFYFSKEKKIKNEIREIFAPIDLNKFNPDQTFIVPDFVDKSKKIITTVASMVPVKGLEYFIEAAERIHERNKSTYFIIAGPEISSQKKYSKKIKSMLINKKFINYVGMFNNIPQLLSHSDLFICSSISEAGPMTVYEAMSMKVPVVTTDVGASRQIIQNLKSGIIVPIKNSTELFNAAEKILYNKELSENIVKEAFISSKNFFSLDKITKQYIEFYNN